MRLGRLTLSSIQRLEVVTGGSEGEEAVGPLGPTACEAGETISGSEC